MSVRIHAINQLSRMVGAREASEVMKLAKKQERLEAAWRRKMKQRVEEITRELLNNARKTGRLNFETVSFEQIVMEHSFSVLKEGIKSAKPKSLVRSEKLASPPKSQIPRSLKALRILWDSWKKTGKMPPRQRVIAKKLRTAYTQKLQSIWVKYGDEFRSGETASTARAVQAVQRGADVVNSRAKMIVETETTFYYNQARREVYDESPDVTHYLFVAIRDHATTKWCKSRNYLVYKKGDPLLDKETPPCHWNCRSELLPLTPLNPAHARIIGEKSKQRRNNRPAPLPPGWTGAR